MRRFVSGTLFGLSMFFVVQVGGEVEGRLFPVMGRLDLSQPRPVDESATRVAWKGQAQKLRDCEFVGLEWYLGPVGGRRVQVHMEFLDPPRVRTPGFLHWDGIVVDLPVTSTLGNSHAIVVHQCAFRPWRTRTLFFVPDGLDAD